MPSRVRSTTAGRSPKRPRRHCLPRIADTGSAPGPRPDRVDVAGRLSRPVGCRYSDRALELGSSSRPWLATVAPLPLPPAEATLVLPRLAYLTLCRSIQLL